ncbi:lipopolysaccharide biosynthesis protein [Sphingomonas colocasiae]|uniref:Lipopolysaccharide biosynthesis protein n=1 Tax=Sphingomonas colocasiae TaxID=1848973 RepID=A0ABS7PHL6_9SPHN|nr:lipopolysaccharide biosynthesis protein [Sphingomonas colocasiae]MBY8820797.1 lipopolysaccharide biosynthesis protein [Sphingomonas colocasiae]
MTGFWRTGSDCGTGQSDLTKRLKTVSTSAHRIPRAINLVKYLLFPGPTDTEENRGRERLRRTFINGFSSLLSRSSTILTLLISVPLALHHLGSERFGMWMIISSFAAILSFADLGIGNGVINLVSRALGRDDQPGIRRSISGGLVILSMIGFALLAALIALYRFIDWPEIFQVKSSLGIEEAGPSAAAFIACFAVGIPAALAANVQIALQRGYEASFWAGLGGLMSLGGLAAAIALDFGTPILVLVLFGTQQFCNILNCLIFFIFRRPDLAPSFSDVDLTTMKDLMRIGSTFLVIQLVVVVSFRIDAVLVTQFFGASAAGQYSLVERLFAIVAMLQIVFLSPLWPAYGEAIGRGDHAWVKATVVRSLFLTIALTAVLAAILVLLSGPLMTLWIGSPLDVPITLFLGFAVWRVLEGVGSALAMLMNAAGALKMQLAIGFVMCAAALLLKLLFVPRLGMASMIWMTNIAYFLFAIIPLAVLIPSLVRRLGKAE